MTGTAVTAAPGFRAGRAGWLASVVALLFLAGCGEGGVRFAEDTRVSPDQIEAVDGDTVRIEGEDYRLLGVSAPRMAPEAGCWAEALLARQARDALALALIGPLEIVPFEQDPPDAVRVFVDGRSLSRVMVEKGFAVPADASRTWCDPLTLSKADALVLKQRNLDDLPAPAARSEARRVVADHLRPSREFDAILASPPPRRAGKIDTETVVGR